MISLITHFGAKGEQRNGFLHLKVYASKKPKKQWGISNALEEVILFENCSLDFSNFLKVRHNFFSSNHRHESNVLNSCFNFRDKPGYISDSWVRFGYRRVFFQGSYLTSSGAHWKKTKTTSFWCGKYSFEASLCRMCLMHIWFFEGVIWKSTPSLFLIHQFSELPFSM